MEYKKTWLNLALIFLAGFLINLFLLFIEYDLFMMLLVSIQFLFTAFFFYKYFKSK